MSNVIVVNLSVLRVMLKSFGTFTVIDKSRPDVVITSYHAKNGNSVDVIFYDDDTMSVDGNEFLTYDNVTEVFEAIIQETRV